MGEKQIVRVLEALNAGCCTSNDISAYTGLSVGIVSNYLTELRKDGLIRITHRNRTRYSKRSPPSHWYEPVNKKQESHADGA